MMRSSDTQHFKEVLLERRRLLDEWFQSPVSLRGDEATLVRQLLAQIHEALRRVDDESYGQCEICHDEVERYRLEVQPATSVCLGCISDKEKAELEEDLYLASKIHRALLPQTIPVINSFDTAVRSLAAGSIGGDYYDFLDGPTENR